MAEIDKLLEYIVRNRQFRLLRTASEVATRATELPDIVADPAAAREREVEASREHTVGFADGLRAAARVEPGGGALVLDDRVGVENRAADALIQYLVRPDLATVETVEVEPACYQYRFSVDWAALREVAERAGVDLDAALGAPRG